MSDIPITKTSHKAQTLQSWDVVRPPKGGVRVLM